MLPRSGCTALRISVRDPSPWRCWAGPAQIFTPSSGVHGGKGAEHLLDLKTLLVRRVAFGIKRFRGRHAASHPKQNAGIGLGGAAACTCSPVFGPDRAAASPVIHAAVPGGGELLSESRDGRGVLGGWDRDRACRGNVMKCRIHSRINARASMPGYRPAPEIAWRLTKRFGELNPMIRQVTSPVSVSGMIRWPFRRK
jgi:hypothetical protein